MGGDLPGCIADWSEDTWQNMTLHMAPVRLVPQWGGELFVRGRKALARRNGDQLEPQYVSHRERQGK